MLAMPFISLMSVAILIDIEVFVISLITRNRLNSTLIITCYRNQVLRLNIACATVQPCGINTHSQLTIRFILVPDT